MHQDERLLIVANCFIAMRELVHPGEVSRVEVDLSDPEAIRLAIILGQHDELAIELFMESSDYPLEAAVTVFDHLQDHLVENGATRGEARPACRPGHAHPASCQRRDDNLLLVCPDDQGVIRKLI
jgi:hypothetical protein